MRKVYKDADSILKTLHQDSDHNQQTSKSAVNKTLLLKIDPSILNYPDGIFQKPLLINFPRKLNPQQIIISTVDRNHKMR